jgi:predicted NBD/HSP70 family sugar kinase
VSSPLLASIDRVHEGAPHRIKDDEKATLYREICAGAPATRGSLARDLGLRPTSVSQAVQELLVDGLVAESQEESRGRSGRPERILVPRHDRLAAISIYVDSRELKGVLVGLDESILAEESRPVPADAGNRALSGAIFGLARSLRLGVPRTARLVGASVSLVGTVNPRTATWVSAARWPKLSDLDLSKAGVRLGFPVALRKTNETELEYWLASNPDAAEKSVVLLHWGFGIGSAVSYRGELLASSIGRFGEIGHIRLGGMSVGRQGSRQGSRRGSGVDAACVCGSTGCLETQAALWALLPRLRARLGALPEDEGELAPILSDPRLLAVPVVRHALLAVQDALLVLHRIFYPDIVLLSGPLVENPVVFDRLVDGFKRSLPGYARGSVQLAVIPGGMGGCRRGGASPLFRDTLRKALRRRT